MPRLFTVMVITLLFTSPVYAGFVNHQEDWNELSTSQKHGYVMGVFDRLTSLSTTDDSSTIALKEYRKECMIRLRFDTADLIQMINGIYATDKTVVWDPPHIALLRAMNMFCGLP